MATVFDVAGFIMNNRGETTAWQLQKLCYYSKAWSLALNNEPLFPEKFGAWKNGPVCRSLYWQHKGMKHIPQDLFEYRAGSLNNREKAVILAVLDQYGDMSGDKLSDITHKEQPWLIARKGIPEGQNSNRNIDERIVKQYYSASKRKYKAMETSMLLFLAKEREKDAEVVSYEDAMKMLDITAEDLC